MTTPIIDFINEYKHKNPTRFHMPGHKGEKILGFEDNDLTEICGADFLFSPDGIIDESEKNATKLFDTKRTVYSTEGSSLSIKTMLFLATTFKENKNVMALRNCHRSFIDACALLDLDVTWVFPKGNINSLTTMNISPDDIEKALQKINKDNMPCAMYITSPDYLGNMLDIKGISRVCKKYGLLLLVDNAHGAYLNFLSDNIHPIHLGADMCCDSAHKTLPTLTGGGYLHIAKCTDDYFVKNVKDAMVIFASTSPSFLILESLDNTNKILSEDFSKRLCDTVKKIDEIKEILKTNDITVLDDNNTEPLKITIDCVYVFNADGITIGHAFEKENIYPEYYDLSTIVLMVSPFNKPSDFDLLLQTLITLKTKSDKTSKISQITFDLNLLNVKKQLSIREAVFKKNESIDIENALGRICSNTVSICPPCIPIIIPGEVFDEDTINILKRYSIFSVSVVK